MGFTTINDISQEAGVSKATVSRVLNNPSIVDPVTRDKVQKVMDERHYVPSAAARNLSKSSSSTIGAVVADISNPFLSELLKGVLEVCKEERYTLLCADNGNDIGMDFKALQTMREQRVAGLVYAPAVDYSFYKKTEQLKRSIHDLGGPVVLVDRKVCWDELPVDGVFFNDAEAIKRSVRMLASCGHRRIGLINSGEKIVLADNRLKGYLDGMAESGLPVDESIVFTDGEYTVETGYEQTKIMLERPQPPTAVITCNNLLSQGFLKAVYETPGKGRDITFVGLDRLEMMDILGIKYNYIKRDSFLMGREAAKLLFDRIRHPDREKRELTLEPPLIFQTCEA